MKLKCETFGKNLKDIINNLGISQADLSRMCDITPAAISQILNNEREPSLKTICKILEVIPVKFERLVK